jgi:regulator of RNase E activity RraB
MRDLRRLMIPDDENGQVLRQMLDDGDDLDAPRGIEFFHVFNEQADAEAFADAASQLPDLMVEAPEIDDEGVWQVCAIRVMAASHAAITALELQLAELAETHNGYADGWGCPPADETAH